MFRCGEFLQIKFSTADNILYELSTKLNLSMRNDGQDLVMFNKIGKIENL